jgi:hypothetical protein
MKTNGAHWQNVCDAQACKAVVFAIKNHVYSGLFKLGNLADACNDNSGTLDTAERMLRTLHYFSFKD